MYSKDRINELTYIIRGCIFQVYNKLGPGLLESVYECALMIELRKAGLKAVNQVAFPVEYDGIRLDLDFRLDILVEDTVIIELKSVESLSKLFYKQLTTYLVLAQKPVGILVNFNCNDLMSKCDKNIYRIVNRNMHIL